MNSVVLAAIFAVLPFVVIGQLRGKQCGGVVCLDNDDVTCIAEENKCQCKDGYAGNGRFGCVDAAESCICYIYGDPYVTGFSTGVTSIPIPCHHTLTDFTTPGGIRVRVSGLAVTRQERNYPGYVFEDQLLITAEKGTTKATALIKRTGFWNKGLKVPLPFNENFPEFGLYCSADKAGYWSLEIPGEGIQIRYRSADSSLTIKAPKLSTYVDSTPCGKCSDPADIYQTLAQQNNMNRQQYALLNAIRNIDTELETNPMCKGLNMVVKNCDEQKRAEAVKFCGLPYSNNQVGSCFVEAYGKEEVLSMVNKCIGSFCANDSSEWCTTSFSVMAKCSTTIDLPAEFVSKCPVP